MRSLHGPTVPSSGRLPGRLRVYSMFRKGIALFKPIKEFLMFLRARWRWGRGRCPLCGRNVYASFSYYMAAYPNCPVCKDETQTDLLMWYKYRTLGTAGQLAAIRVKD
jgi:hypothetical protein